MSTKYLSCAETAKILRAALKAAHPSVKFGVRSSSYAGGASIRVYWTDGPTTEMVNKTAKMYAGSSFDGMTDMKTYHSTVLVSAEDAEVVHFGADFVFTERTESEEFVNACLDYVSDNGSDSQSSQCGHCGNWTPAGRRWVANVHNHGGDFCCSAVCAARKMARYSSDSLFTVLKSS